MKTKTFLKAKLAFAAMIVAGCLTGCGSSNNGSDFQTQLVNYLKKGPKGDCPWRADAAA